MKIVLLYVLFFILSTLLMVLTLTQYMRNSLLKKEIRVAKSQKNYLKNRDKSVPIRTLATAQKKIEVLLDTNPHLFDNNSISLEQNSSNEKTVNSTKVTLSNLVKIVNHLDEEAILTIKTYSKNKGSKKYNLGLSQQRADVLKQYFIERTSLPLIVAIGYGGAIPLDKKNRTHHREIEINLQRIK